MRTRKPIKATKVVTASHTGVTKHTHPNVFREGKIRAYLRELGMDVREYTRMSAIRTEMRMLSQGIVI
jgi:hypothetical protein